MKNKPIGWLLLLVGGIGFVWAFWFLGAKPHLAQQIALPDAVTAPDTVQTQDQPPMSESECDAEQGFIYNQTVSIGEAFADAAHSDVKKHPECGKYWFPPTADGSTPTVCRNDTQEINYNCVPDVNYSVGLCKEVMAHIWWDNHNIPIDVTVPLSSFFRVHPECTDVHCYSSACERE
jgi:hypothetical protein